MTSGKKKAEDFSSASWLCTLPQVRRKTLSTARKEGASDCSDAPNQCTFPKQRYLLQRGCGRRASTGQRADLGANHCIPKGAEGANTRPVGRNRIRRDL